MSDLAKRLQTILNQESAENGSDTPDFILAQYMIHCLDAFDFAVREREKWYGRAERTNEHGNVIDYGPQFSEDDDPTMEAARESNREIAARMERDALRAIRTPEGEIWPNRIEKPEVW